MNIVCPTGYASECEGEWYASVICSSASGEPILARAFCSATLGASRFSWNYNPTGCATRYAQEVRWHARARPEKRGGKNDTAMFFDEGERSSQEGKGGVAQG